MKLALEEKWFTVTANSPEHQAAAEAVEIILNAKESKEKFLAEFRRYLARLPKAKP